MTAASSVYNYDQLFALGINNPTLSTPLSVFPNPSAQGVFFLNVTTPDATLNVYDPIGNLILQQVFPTTGMYPIDVSKVATEGIYLFSVTSKRGLQTARVIYE